MNSKDSKLVMMRDSMHTRMIELAKSHNLSIVDTVTYALAYVYSLEKQEREEIIEKGSGLFVLLDMNPNIKLDMSTEDFRKEVLKGLDDVLKS